MAGTVKADLVKTLRRGIGDLLGLAGLAYPACAAICPKGRGACPYPGRCFLYTDADLNSVCDYTPRSPAAGTQPSVAAPATTAPVPAPAGGAPSGPSSAPVMTDPGVAGFLREHALPAGFLIFLLLTAGLYYAFRSGTFGSRIGTPGPALALASLLSLGISGIATVLLMGDAASASSCAAVYLLAGTLLTGYLWKSGAMTRGVVLATGGTSLLFGFGVTALIMPAEFVGLARIATGSQTLAPGILAILAALALAAVTGRTFCGHICPVGAAQELAYTVPSKKIVVRRRWIPELIRFIVFCAAVIFALAAADLAGLTGAYDFFSFTLSAGSAVFALLLLVAVVLYRPVCRAICPFGLLFSLAAQVSRFRLFRTGACINCTRCEKACPAQVATREDSRRECYLCGRCTAACPVEGALWYTAERPPLKSP